MYTRHRVGFARAWLMTLAIVTAVASGCGEDGDRDVAPATAEALAAPGRFSVGLTTVTLLDASRTTPPGGSLPGSDVRSLVTDLYYPAVGDGLPGEIVPAAPVALEAGPFPLIIFAHGFFGSRTNFAGTLEHLASHGYVVAAPEFPRTNLSTLGTHSYNLVDFVNQPGDVSFVIDTLTGHGDAAGEEYAAAVDGGAVGLLGHSFGGGTALLSVFGGPLADPRVGAVAAVAPFTCVFAPGMLQSMGVPLMLVHGTSDMIADVAWSEEIFPLLPAPKWFAEIVGGDHLGYLADPNLPPNLRDAQVSGLFAAESDRFPAQFADLEAALRAQVPGIDPGHCAIRPIFPDPNSIHDPLVPAPRQRQITDVALTAFLGAFVQHDRSAERFLAEGFSALAPEVRLFTE